MNINSLKYSFRQSLVSLSRNFWLAVVTAVMIAISLAILGGFLLLAVNVGQSIRIIESNVEINAFLYDDADVEAIQAKLDNLQGVQGYTFVSKDQGLVDFGQAIGDTILLSGLEGDNNPLPDLIRVQVEQAETVPELARVIQGYPGVELADYGEELVGMLIRITRWLNALFLGASVLLALGAVFLIVTIIRLSVMARQEEIGIMKYLGASNWFIRFPFLLEGTLMGWFGTMIATVSLGLIYYRVVASLQRESLAFFLQPVTDAERLFPIFAGLLVLGTLMGCIGSYLSVRKYLRV
ncbi:MAG: permease-like cell division protein FtsX [Clostridiales bacterium]|jgi:cell division transport system permease protein|nr:permease-like cell division protein FtsX [Clostridiales bacterium]